MSINWENSVKPAVCWGVGGGEGCFPTRLWIKRYFSSLDSSFTSFWNQSWPDHQLVLRRNGEEVDSGPQCLGLWVPLNKGTYCCQNAFHIQILELDPWRILLYISKDRADWRADFPVFVEFHKRSIDSPSELVCQEEIANLGLCYKPRQKDKNEACGGLALCPRMLHWGFRAERRLFFFFFNSSNV